MSTLSLKGRSNLWYSRFYLRSIRITEKEGRTMKSKTRIAWMLAIMLSLGNVFLLSLTKKASSASDSIGDRGDIRFLPAPLKNRIIELADRPTSTVPTTAFSEADSPSQLFQYYLLDTTHFQ